MSVVYRVVQSPWTTFVGLLAALALVLTLFPNKDRPSPKPAPSTTAAVAATTSTVDTTTSTSTTTTTTTVTPTTTTVQPVRSLPPTTAPGVHAAGSLYEAWTKVAICEEGGWVGAAGYAYPDSLGITRANWIQFGGGSDVSPAAQIAVAERLIAFYHAGIPDQNGCQGGGW